MKNFSIDLKASAKGVADASMAARIAKLDREFKKLKKDFEERDS